MKNSDFKPYESKREFKDDLKRVFKKDYGVELSEEELEEATNNLTNFCGNLLNCYVNKTGQQ